MALRRFSIILPNDAVDNEWTSSYEGKKKYQTRVNCLARVYSNSIEKILLLIIGSAAQPRCLRGASFQILEWDMATQERIGWQLPCFSSAWSFSKVTLWRRAGKKVLLPADCASCHNVPQSIARASQRESRIFYCESNIRMPALRCCNYRGR